MDIKDLKNQSRDRLHQMAGELRATVRNLRFTVSTRQRADVRTLRTAKKDLARVLTLWNIK